MAGTIKVVQRHAFLGGGLWFAAWLFTIGFLHLGFWRGVQTRISNSRVADDAMDFVPPPEH